MIEALAYGAVAGVLCVFVAGLRRWPWRYASLVGLGWGVIFAALRLAVQDVDPGVLVLLGGLGGALATLGSERGERERVRRSDSILASGHSSLD